MYPQRLHATLLNVRANACNFTCKIHVVLAVSLQLNSIVQLTIHEPQVNLVWHQSSSRPLVNLPDFLYRSYCITHFSILSWFSLAEVAKIGFLTILNINFLIHSFYFNWWYPLTPLHILKDWPKIGFSIEFDFRRWKTILLVKIFLMIWFYSMVGALKFDVAEFPR